MGNAPTANNTLALYANVRSQVSSLGDTPASWYCALESGFSTVKHCTELSLVVGESHYSSGVLMSSFEFLHGMADFEKHQVLLQKVFTNGDHSLTEKEVRVPVILQLPKRLQNKQNDFLQCIPEECRCLGIRFDDAPGFETVKWITETLTLGGYDRLLLAVVESNTTLDGLYRQAHQGPLATPDNEQGMIAGEGALLIEFSLSPITGGVCITHRLEQNTEGTRRQNVQALKEIIQQTPSLTSGASGSVLVIMDNPAMAIEQEWQGARMSLTPEQRKVIPEIQRFPTHQEGVFGLVNFWQGIGYAQGLQDYPFCDSKTLTVVQALTPKQRSIMTIELTSMS